MHVPVIANYSGEKSRLTNYREAAGRWMWWSLVRGYADVFDAAPFDLTPDERHMCIDPHNPVVDQLPLTESSNALALVCCPTQLAQIAGKLKADSGHS